MRSEITHKPCSKCKEVKPLDAFSPAKKGPLGRKSDCKKCNARYAAKKKAQKEAEDTAIEASKLTYPRIPDHMKQCKYCLEIKVKDENFRKRADTKCGFGVKCNTCFNRDRPSRAGSQAAKKLWKKYYAKKRDELLRNQKENEIRKKKQAERYENNKEEIKRKQKEYSKTSRAKALNARRQSHRNRRLSRAQPKWLSEKHLQEMNDIYWLAQDLKVITGEVYHVDHIVPLQGKNICGLHVPWNLQVLPADLNIRKSNKMET